MSSQYEDAEYAQFPKEWRMWGCSSVGRKKNVHFQVLIHHHQNQASQGEKDKRSKVEMPACTENTTDVQYATVNSGLMNYWIEL